MKKNKKSFLTAAAMALTVTAGMTMAGQPALAAEKSEPIDLDSFTEAFAINYDTPQLHPISGWYTETVMEGRTIKVYIPEKAVLRTHFNAVAVPDGVDTWDFLKEEGWIDRAESAREGLFVLEPGAEGWGTVEEENDYVTKAMAVLTGQSNHNKVSLFSTHGTFAVAGYEKGCAPMEAWVLGHPLHVYTQVYVDGEGLDESYYQAARDSVYDAAWPGSRQITPEEFERVMGLMGLTTENAGTKADVPIPTWFVGYDEADPSIAFWKNANDCQASPDMNGVFHQDINSDAWQSLYANANIKKWDPKTTYGLTEVHVTDAITVDQAYDFMSAYSNYTTLCSYSNNITSRMDYYDLINRVVDATEKAEAKLLPYTDYDGKEAYAELLALDSQRVSFDRCPVEGTMYAGTMATRDVDGNGKLDPRTFMVYVPDSAEKYGETGAPLVLVSPGATQTATCFVDCSGWVQIANDEGCILIVQNQPYSNATSVKYHFAETGVDYKGENSESSDYVRGLMSFMKNEFDGKMADIDFTRVYASGHSAGSNASEELGLVDNSDWLAAIGSTSFITRTEQFSEGYMPTYLIVGHKDINDARIDLDQDPYATQPTHEGADTLYAWLHKVLAKNQMDVDFTPDDKDALIATCSTFEDASRYKTYGWSNDQGIEMVKLSRTYLREHNCYPEDFRYIWAFMKNFKLVQNADGTQTRYYSASGFAQNDLVEIGAPVQQKAKITAIKSCTKAYGDKAFNVNASTNSDAKLTYSSSNTKVATVNKKGKVTIKGTGKAVITISAAETRNFTAASKKVTIKVVPQAAKINSVKSNAKGKATIKVKKDTKATGYQVEISLKKTFKDAKMVTLKSNTKVETTVSKLAAGKTYYVRARSYKTMDGVKNFGAYSAVKTVKIKK